MVGTSTAHALFEVSSSLPSVQGNPVSVQGVAISHQPVLRLGVSPGLLCSKPGTVDYQYKPLGLDSLGAAVGVGPAAPSSSDTSVVTVAADGRVTTRASTGNAKVIGKAQGLTAYGSVVITATPESCRAR